MELAVPPQAELDAPLSQKELDAPSSQISLLWALRKIRDNCPGTLINARTHLLYIHERQWGLAIHYWKSEKTVIQDLHDLFKLFNLSPSPLDGLVYKDDEECFRPQLILRNMLCPVNEGLCILVEGNHYDYRVIKLHHMFKLINLLNILADQGYRLYDIDNRYMYIDPSRDQAFRSPPPFTESTKESKEEANDPPSTQNEITETAQTVPQKRPPPPTERTRRKSKRQKGPSK